MEFSPLTALSPLDGRYFHQTEKLRLLVSEYGLMRLRNQVEISWLEALAQEPGIPEIPPLSKEASDFLRNLSNQFNEADAARIKEIEKTTQHDVKAIEYFLKEKMAAHPELNNIKEFVHFACTSEDINNLAYALLLKSARQDFLLPRLDQIISVLRTLAHEHANTAMLSHTHGQAATPTTVGKEFANVAARLMQQTDILRKIKMYGKCNGAVGNFNAHLIAYPTINWMLLSERFVTQLGLHYNAYTTQIEPHDFIAELCHSLIRCNTICIDFNRDIWGYIALGYFRQRAVGDTVGSSTMPHKINPIDFENSEGNLGLANAILEHMAAKLPISRWQRDLSDSTLLRNLGVAIGHTLIGYQSLLNGMDKLAVDQEAIHKDLNKHWAVLGEAIQTVMRRNGLEKPYEQLKALTRGKSVDADTLQKFIDTLHLPESVKKELRALTPWTYLGNAATLARSF